MKKTCLSLVLALAAHLAFSAARVMTLLSDGWTADGVPVTLPHTWNAADGEDGYTPAARAEMETLKARGGIGELLSGWRANSACTEVGYARKAVAYVHALPDPKPGRRFFFRCDGAAIAAEVYVNGVLVGRHLGAYTGFCYELTDQLLESGNELAVIVDSRPNRDIPTLSADFTVFGGIYRDAWLVETDSVCIDPTVHGGPGVSVAADPKTGAVRVKVLQRGGELPVTCAVDGKSVGGTDFAVKDPVLWSPETPKVYRLTATLSNGDAVTVPFGFRTCGFDGEGRFTLNGRPLRLRGVSRHQDLEGKGWCLTRADEARDVALMKEMGVNAVRTAHYPQSQNVYDLLDGEGLLAWCELPCTDALSPTPAFRATAEEMVREMVAQLGSHPSIVMWSVFNEVQNGWAPQLPEAESARLLGGLRDLYKALDPTRPVVAATCNYFAQKLNAVPDELGFNGYPGWYVGGSLADLVDRYLKDTGRKSVSVSEYGAGANPAHHRWPAVRVPAGGPFHPEEYQALVHAEQYAAVASRPDVWGTFIWAMFDFASDNRDEGGRPGINDKGLVTRDRRVKKDAYYFYQANWTKTPVLRLVGAKCAEVATNEVPVLVFANTGRVALSVNGKPLGAVEPDACCCARWANVRLKPGENKVEVESAGRRVAATWFVK